jgi:hypothetical protein
LDGTRKKPRNFDNRKNMTPPKISFYLSQFMLSTHALDCSRKMSSSTNAGACIPTPTIAPRTNKSVVEPCRKRVGQGRISDNVMEFVIPRLLGVNDHSIYLNLSPFFELIAGKGSQNGLRLAIEEHLLLHDHEYLLGASTQCMCGDLFQR